MNVNALYLEHLATLSDDTKAKKVTARGNATREIIGKTFNWPLFSPIITLPARKLNYRFMLAEAAWILSGRNDLDYIQREMKQYAKYSDDGQTLAGAYGPPIVDQLSYVVQSLNDDIGTRQAVLSIWRPRPAPSKDIPCTCLMQFIIREGKLNIAVSMRSSDAYLGIPYDLFSFSMVAYTVAGLLRTPLQLGTGHLFMGSSHIYDTNRASVNELLEIGDNHEQPSPILRPDVMADRRGILTRQLVVEELEAAREDCSRNNIPQSMRWVERRLGSGELARA